MLEFVVDYLIDSFVVLFNVLHVLIFKTIIYAKEALMTDLLRYRLTLLALKSEVSQER